MLTQKVRYTLVAIFSIFVGSQITEGALFVPYWKSLSPEAFYQYYKEFGPGIGQFYTVLTIVAAAIPIVLSIYHFRTHSSGKWYAVISAVLSIVFILFFYIYFKGTNELFYQSALGEQELNEVLSTWSRVHWSRVVVEVLAMIFLVLSLTQDEDETKID